MTLSMMMLCFNAVRVSIMLSVTNKPIMLSVVMLSVMVPLERLARDKRSSLFGLVVSLTEKSFKAFSLDENFQILACQRQQNPEQKSIDI
jgi:hypothetical protein